MYMYVHIVSYVCMCMCMCMCIYICIHDTYLYNYIILYIYIYIMYLHIYVCMYTSYNFWRSYVSFGLSMANSLTCHFAFFSVMPGLRATQEVLQWDGKILWTQMLVALKSYIFHRSFYKPKLLGIHLWSPLQEDLMFAHCLTMPTIVSEYLINCHEI